jgi:hypothetical protein
MEITQDPFAYLFVISRTKMSWKEELEIKNNVRDITNNCNYYIIFGH